MGCRQAGADPLGCLGDLGWYSVRFSLWAYDYELPTAVRAVLHRATNKDGGGVPLHLTGSMRWADDEATAAPAAELGLGASRTATFLCSPGYSNTVVHPDK